MDKFQYYHYCAKGTDARNFILCEADYVAVFNIIGLCAAVTGAVVVSFSIEDSHPHILMYGYIGRCARFKVLFETTIRHYAVETRKECADFVLRGELYSIGDDLSYLRNVAVYTIIQATKDGKHVMPYDYRWGTGSMYFRSSFYTPVWLFDKEGTIREPVCFGSLSVKEQLKIVHTRKYSIPDNWLICNGLILPSNYIDVARFEAIYGTYNRFRVYLSSPKSREEEILSRMAEERGVALEDVEARNVCGDECKVLFGTRDPRRLTASQRVELARALRKKYRLTRRQLATVVRLPETEIQIFVP
ncbi:MAG: hypothetical protein IJK20_01040 [Bacteroidales bacterium]|nr:hypothetical protein [Bacteroidales bacterium]